jgi:hypothetical protein
MMRIVFVVVNSFCFKFRLARIAIPFLPQFYLFFFFFFF